MCETVTGIVHTKCYPGRRILRDYIAGYRQNEKLPVIHSMNTTDNLASIVPSHPSQSELRPTLRLLFWLLLAFAPMTLYHSGATVVLLFALTLVSIWDSQDRKIIFSHSSSKVQMWLFVALMGYGLLSISWAGDLKESFYDWWRIALILSCGWILLQSILRLDPSHCRYLLGGVMWGTGLLILSLIVEWLGDGQIASLFKDQQSSNLLFTSRSCAVLAVIVGPLTLYGATRLGAWATGLFSLLALMMIALLPLFSASIAVVSAAVVFICQRCWPRITPWILALSIILTLFLMPLAGVQSSSSAQSIKSLPKSWVHRLVIWEFFAERVQQSPWVGHGIGSAHGLSKDPSALADYQRIARVYGNAKITAQPPLHPHNAVLQLWHDLGLVGVLGASVLILLVIRGLVRGGFGPNALAVGLAALTAWLVIAGVSFGLWQKWWLACSGISLTIYMLMLRGLYTQGNITDA